MRWILSALPKRIQEACVRTGHLTQASRDAACSLALSGYPCLMAGSDCTSFSCTVDYLQTWWDTARAGPPLLFSSSFPARSWLPRSIICLADILCMSTLIYSHSEYPVNMCPPRSGKPFTLFETHYPIFFIKQQCFCQTNTIHPILGITLLMHFWRARITTQTAKTEWWKETKTWHSSGWHPGTKYLGEWCLLSSSEHLPLWTFWGQGTFLDQSYPHPYHNHSYQPEQHNT